LTNSNETAEDNKGQQESKPTKNKELTTTRQQADSSQNKPVKVPTDIASGTEGVKTKSFRCSLKGCPFAGVASAAK
jgi:hypothetical protein